MIYTLIATVSYSLRHEIRHQVANKLKLTGRDDLARDVMLGGVGSIVPDSFDAHDVVDRGTVPIGDMRHSYIIILRR